MSDPCSLRLTFTRRFWFLVSAIPEPCCFPGLRSPETRLPIASLRYPPQPPRKAPHLPTESSVSALRKAPHLPTESSVSAYGSSASALRKAPFLPTEAPPLPYGKLRFCPTESSASAYGKLRFCLRKLRLCPTESSVSAYGSSASALRKAPLLPTEAPPLPYGKLRLVSRCVLLPVINSLSATESSRLHCDRRI